MPKAVIFDSDGMLSHGPQFSAQYATEHGISIDEMTPFFTGPFKKCLIGQADLKEELAKGWLEKWQWQGSVDELLQYWFSVGDHLDEEVFATVAEIRARNIPCVLATNQEKYRTDYLSKKFGYDLAFDKVFSSAYVGHKKPSAEFFDDIFAYLNERIPNISKSEVMFWDDDVENVEGARAYGLDARHFINAQAYKKEMEALLR